MNTRTALIAAIALDLILASLLLMFLTRPKPAPAPIPQVSVVTNVMTRPLPPASSTAASPTLFDWRMVESEDYKKYIANLRTIGCPEETIRDIITADVNKLFESRRRELRKDKPKFQFWKTGSPLAGLLDPDMLLKQQELAKEKRELLKELLGTAPDEKPDLMMAGLNPFETMLDFLPASKQTQVMELMQKQQAKMMKLVGGGQMDAEDMKKMRDIQRDMDREMAQVLTPAELEDYQLRMSQTAMMMRFSLGAFEPTEQEFREIFQVRKPFDDDYSSFVDGTDQVAMQKRAEAETQMKEAVRKLLGDARYAEYERSQDYSFQQLSKLAERQGLPRDAAIKAYDMSRTAQEQFMKVQQDPQLNAEQRRSAVDGIRAETERSMRQVLGDQGYEGFRKQPTSYWLRTEPQPVPQPTEHNVVIPAP